MRLNDGTAPFGAKLIVTLSVSISFGIQRFVSTEEGKEGKTEREEREEEDEEEEENELEVDDYEEEEAAENIKNIKEEEGEEEVEEEEEEDEESKGVTSKIKSQFANFSVLSLLARKTPDKEEKVMHDCPHTDFDRFWQ